MKQTLDILKSFEGNYPETMTKVAVVAAAFSFADSFDGLEVVAAVVVVVVVVVVAAVVVEGLGCVASLYVGALLLAASVSARTV
jgi:type IV secretory pathway VirB2 component (pilin)